MEWYQVKNIVQRHPVKTIQETASDTDFGNAIFISDFKITLLPTVLYFCASSNLPRLLDSAEKADPGHKFLFVTFDDKPLPEEVFSDPHLGNIIILPNETSFHSLYSEILSALELERAIEFNFRQLIIQARKNPPLSTLAEQISEMYHNYPVFLVNNTFMILAHSSVSGSFKELQEDVDRGCVELSALPDKNDIIHPDPGIAPSTSIFINQRIPVNTYHTTITVNSLPIGYLDIFVDKSEKLSDLEISYLSFISEILSNRFQKDAYQLQHQTSQLAHFFTELVSGNAIPEEELESKIRGFGYDLRKKKRLIVLIPEGHFYTHNELYSIGTSLHQLFHNSIFITHENALLFLTSANEESEFKGLSEDVWNKIASLSSFKMGISSVFYLLKEIPEKWREAVAAVKTGELFLSDQRIFFFEQLQLHYAAMQLNNAPEEADLIRFRPVLTLLDYDNKHDSELLKTLYYYLRWSKRISFLCDQLHIHKNTLYARLKHIFQMFPSASIEKWSSIDVNASIYLTLLMLQAEGKLYFDL